MAEHVIRVNTNTYSPHTAFFHLLAVKPFPKRWINHPQAGEKRWVKLQNSPMVAHQPQSRAQRKAKRSRLIPRPEASLKGKEGGELMSQL